MEHHFKIEDAVEHGIVEAILLYNIRFWVEKNKASNRHIYDGKVWTYNSVRAWAELFPYLSEAQIRHALKKLSDSGVIETGNFNKKGYDRTKWYCLKEQVHLSPIANAFVTHDRPIPDNKQQIVNTDIPMVQESTEVEPQEQKLTLPINRGKTSANRVLSIYNDCFKGKYGFGYKANFKRDISLINSLLESYTEVQLARLFICYFEWAGMSGSDFKETNFLSSATYPIALFKSNTSKYEAYVRNVLKEDFDNEQEIYTLVGKYINKLSTV